MSSRQNQRPPAPTRGESGHLLLIVMMGLVVMSIMLGALVQQWSAIQRRENEEELIFRGNQYVKAIKLYQAEHGGALPTSLEILIQPGPRQRRYIRRLFRDPMVPDGKWGILLADPSGKGYINPNAPPPTGDEGVAGLEDLGKGLSSDTQNSKPGPSISRNSSRDKSYFAKPGESSWTDSFTVNTDDDKTESITAPGQPVGPIVGVVSLADLQTSFRLFRQHENYTEWAFNIFEDDGAAIQQKQQPVSPGAALPSGIGPGGAQTIVGGANGPVGGTGPAPMPGFPGITKKP